MAVNGVDLYSYLPGLEVTASEILEAESIAYQILQAKFQDLDLREGTALRDLAIRPNATLLAMINKALIFYFQQNTLSDVDDETPRAFVDKILSNFFINRKEGNSAIISARLYFARSKDISIPSDVFFSPDNVLKYFPSASISFSQDQLTYDSSANQYYIDVDLVAERAGVTYNITGGSLIYFSNFDPYFLHAEINFLRQTAEDVESNSEFIDRTSQAISTRNLVNRPSIEARLMEDFSGIDAISSYGFSDPEMIRDMLKVLVPGVAEPIWIHNGGKVDVYCRVPLASSIIQLPANEDGDIFITGAAYKIERSQLSGGDDPDEIPFYDTKVNLSIAVVGTVATVVTASAHEFSDGEEVTIMGAIPVALNRTVPVTVIDSTTFTYEVPAGTGSAVLPGESGVPLAFTITNDAQVFQSVTSLTATGTTAIAESSNHGLVAGERIVIRGAAQTPFNGTFRVTNVLNKDEFTYTVPSGTPALATGVIELGLIDRREDVGFSDRQVLRVSFGAGYAGETASFVVYYFQNMDGIQDYLNDAVKRVLCGDYLARGFNLTSLDIEITGYNGPAPDSAISSEIIKKYLTSLDPGQPFIMADLLAELYAAGIKTIKTPLDISFVKYWNDLGTVTSGTIEDTLNPNDTRNIFVLNSVTTQSDQI